ncbi:MAG: transposase [Bacteroidetes bacterium GWE2_29_8]|nr:MAG: transposase [Bacteroidetes bacterium GWE2_29_8]OFY22169.1 MAG: transposase [Bacteroidetes bacterium GWF2_29_10]
MTSYRQIYYHIVFETNGRADVLIKEHQDALYKYIWGIIKENNCVLYRINGVGDHIHILCDLHPMISLGNLVRDVKAGSSKWIKQSGYFPNFKSWRDGYAAFTCSYLDKDKVINYINNQEEHHRKISFVDELKTLLKDNNIQYDNRYL